MSSLILIVDDNPEDREIIRAHLSQAATAEELSFRFRECSGGEAGLAAYHTDKPDCILLDYHLQDMDGLEFLERLKDGAQGLPVPVVLLTGSVDVSLSIDALRAGAQEYVQKRLFGPEVLFHAVRSAQDHFRLFGQQEMPEVWKALTLSQAETRAGQTNLLASEVALSASRAETQDGLADLMASAAALSASRAETQDGLADLLASAAALSVSRTETQDGRAELLASAVVNKALSVANALLVTSDAAVRANEARLRDAFVIRQTELEQVVAERNRALVEAEARFRGIFDAQFQFISLLDRDGTIIEMNRTALDAGSLARADVVGRPFWMTHWWSSNQRSLVQQDIAIAAAGGVIRREIEVRDTRDQGRGIWIDMSFKPVRDPVTGTVTSIVAESHDLTEKRAIADQLAQAQKVQALGQLAAGIAHDFNNILHVVSGAVALIEQRPGDLERTRRLARSAITAADRGMSITQRLLSFARRGELRAEPIATAHLVHNLCEVLTHTLGSTITVRADVRPDVPPIMADRALLETAMINLGINSRDAMPNGGLLVISAEVEHVGEGRQHSAGLEAGNYVRLTVSDNGTGMDAATLARVSEPFFTTKPPGQGTGLGVAMAKGFAGQSGGGLSIASSLGAGTTVVMWLRQATEAVQHSSEAINLSRKPTAHSACVLVVDDDDLVRELLAAQLDEAGFHTIVAASGKEALGLIEADDRIDVLVSDLSMPGMDGVATIRQARALRPALPCFLLTGYVGDGAASSAENAFVLARKPITGKVLAAQIETALEGAQA